MDQKTFIKNLRSWQNGSISRRDFLGRTGLGLPQPWSPATCPAC